MSHRTLSRHVLRAVVGRASARHHVVGHVAYTDKHSTTVAIKLNIQQMVFRQYDIKVENPLNVAHSYRIPPHSVTYVTLIETKKPVTLTRT